MRRINTYNTLVLVIVAFFASHTALAQKQTMFTQYMFNGLSINPAYAGSHDAMSLTFHSRTQWTRYPGAPNTQTFSAHSPLRNNRVGLGLTVMHYNIGVTSQTTFIPSYAYRIIMDEGILSLGLQAQMQQYRGDLSEIELTDPTDEAYAKDINKWMFNFGFGGYYYTNKYFIGASMPLVLRNNLSTTNTSNNQAEISYLYAITGGYLFEINEDIKLKPNALISGEKNFSKLDLNCNVYLMDMFGAGLSYRWAESLSFVAEIFITKELRIAYSYDYVLGKLNNDISGGSHEVMINYRFNWDKGEVVNPRYF